MSQGKMAYSAYRINNGRLRPIRDHVLVQDMQFEERRTSTGIVLLNDNGTGLGIRPRWGKIYAVGPEQEDLAVGQWIMVAHGRWTRGVDIEDDNGKHTIRRIDPKDVLLISDEEPQDDTISDAVHIQAQKR